MLSSNNTAAVTPIATRPAESLVLRCTVRDGHDTAKQQSQRRPSISREGGLEALHGIRALACIAIVLGHCMFALGFAWPQRHLEWYHALVQHPWMLALVNLPEPAMDTFLILSGFLAAHSLLPAMQGKGSPLPAVRQYYSKRMRRMLPSYYSILAFVYAAFLPLLKLQNARAPEAQQAIGTLWFNEGDGCPDKLWANFLFVNNNIRRAGCMKYAWSQAVQMQFFLLCPLLMLRLRAAAQTGLNRRLAKASSAIIVAVTAYRAVIALDFKLPVPVFGPLDDREALDLMTRTLKVFYYSLLPRLTHLAFGMLGASAVRSPGTTAFLGARKRMTGGLSALAAALLCAALLSNRYGPEPVKGHPLNSPAAKVIGVAGITGLLQPAALTLLLCCAVLGVSPRVTRALAWTGWRWVADVSYDMYLVHPMVMYAVWTVLPPSAWFVVQKPSALRFLAVSAIVFWCSFGLAKVHKRIWSRLL